MSDLDTEALRRWRLVLGTDSGEALAGLTGIDQSREQALDYLYQREYLERSQLGQEQYEGHSGGNESTQPTPAHWLAGVRRVFPHSVVDILQRQAIERYGLTTLLTDPEVLRQTTPNMELVHTLLSFRNQLTVEVMSEVRRIIRTVCAELEAVLSQRVRSRLGGRGPRCHHGGRPSLNHLDWPVTLRHNLKHYDLAEQLPVLERLFFTRRRQQREVWDLFLLVDQSASMMDAIVHSAVLAAIFCGVRSLRTHLILFDTSIVDLTDRLDDPVETLLAVQLGGGTDIGSVLAYTAERLTQPSRSLVVLISDFEEGGSPDLMYAQVECMRDAGATLLGLAALDDTVDPAYNEWIARRLATLGMEIAALTPEHLAERVAVCLADAS
jgi:Mg-chelatase subunit ChlD